MAWSEETMAALDRWVTPDTAYKHHPIDDVRFYVFVGNVWRDLHGLWDESQAKETVTHRVEVLHEDWPADLAEGIGERARSEGTLILDFLCGLKDSEQLDALLTRQ